MKPNEIVKEIMRLRGYSNQSLASKLGKSTASAISNPLSREKGMRVDTLLEMVSAMDCEIVVRSLLKDKTEWVVSSISKTDANTVDLDTLLKDEEPDSNPKPKKSGSRIKLTK